MNSNDFIWPHLRLGIPNPVETAKGVAPTCDEMRKAIHDSYHDSALIKQCLYTAARTGMSGEDTYVLLAYHALLQLERAHRRLQELNTLLPFTPKVTR